MADKKPVKKDEKGSKTKIKLKVKTDSPAKLKSIVKNIVK